MQEDGLSFTVFIYFYPPMKYILFFSILLAVVACRERAKKLSPGEEFDRLESIFATENWKYVDGADTSYLYASRVGDHLFNVYRFDIEAGDSVRTEMSTIRLDRDSIRWHLAPDSLVLESADSAKAIWITTGSEVYRFVKISADSIRLERPGGRPAVIMRRTLPLATFLVRSHYDFLHGTHTVDSPIVPHRGPELELE